MTEAVRYSIPNRATLIETDMGVVECDAEKGNNSLNSYSSYDLFVF